MKETSEYRMHFLGTYYTVCPFCATPHQIEHCTREKVIFCDNCRRDFRYVYFAKGDEKDEARRK